jgi:hypothetical protein
VHKDDAGSLTEPMTEQLWLDAYRRAVSALAGGQPDFAVLFAGSVFDLSITFRRLDKGYASDLLRQSSQPPQQDNTHDGR